MTRPTIKILLALLTTAMMTGAASAQQRTFYDSSGKVVGRSATDSQGSATIYDSSGKVVGRETTSVSIRRGPPGWSFLPMLTLEQ